MIRKSTLLRYARSLAEVAVEAGIAENIGADFAQLDKILKESPELTALLKNPIVSPRNKTDVLGALGARAGWHKYFRDFLRVLAENHRLPYLHELYPLFLDELDRLRGIVTAKAWTAQPLSMTSESDLAAALRNLSGKSVKIVSQLDPSLIGGVRVEMEGTVYDGSVRRQLERLVEHLVPQA